MAQWYYADESGNRFGPYSARQLREKALDGKVLPTHLVWSDDMAGWESASKVKGLFDRIRHDMGKGKHSPPPITADASDVRYDYDAVIVDCPGCKKVHTVTLECPA